MFFRRRSLFEFSSNRLSKAPRRQKRRGRAKASELVHRRPALGIEQLEDRIVLTTPTVLNVTPSDTLITDGDVGASAFSIAVQYSEAMTADGTSDPTLVFDPNVASTLSFATDSWSADMQTYTAVFNVADAGVNIVGVDVNISGGRDAAGDLQAAFDALNEFDINTEVDVLSITASDNLLTDADVGAGNFSVTVVYDEPMVSDGSQDPTITFNPNVASTLTLANGSWSPDGTTYTATYNVADANVDVTGIDITTTGGEDLAGNAPAVATETDEFNIDTENPTVLSVTPSPAVIADADVGNNTFSLDVQYSEAMTTDGSADPTIVLNPAVASTLTFDAAASTWINATTYRAVYDVADADVDAPNVGVTITGAEDAVGNLQVANVTTVVFGIDTQNPTVASINVSDTMVTDADVGVPFTVVIVYSEAMTADGSADPTITFNPGVASTLSFVSGAWSAGDTTYTGTFNVADAGVTVNGIDVMASGAEDAAGNVQIAGTVPDLFQIDTENPTVVSVTPSDLLISDIDVANPFTIDVLFSEPMIVDGSADPTLTFDPEVSTTLSLAGGSWSADMLTYTATYDVMDDNVEVFDIGVAVANGQDAKGNLQVPANFLNVFEVDTLELTIAGSAPYLIFNDFATINNNDIDFFQYTAHHTGKLVVNLFFADINGDLDLEVRDSADNVIVSSTSITDNEEVVLPVVTQETYSIRVLGKALTDMNEYDLEIENFAAPAPAFVDLIASSDTGISSTDNITSDTTPSFLVQADLVDFRDMGITLLNQATIDPNNDGDAADATDDGSGVFVTIVNLGSGAVTEGFANQVGVSGFLWSFTPAAALAPGDYFITSAVQIVDGQQDPSRETGRAQLSDPLLMTILDIVPPGGTSADLLSASDSGMSATDNVTNIRAAAFQGIAQAGATVRLYANGQLVGQSTAGSDSSDVGIGAIGGIGGLSNDGLGLWEITTEPLVDGAYDITLEVEDAAGSVAAFDVDLDSDVATTIDLVVDGLAPNTPVLDLRDDSGQSLSDEITNTTTPNVFMTTTDPNITLAQNLFTDNLKFRIFDRFENNAETLIYDSAIDAAADNTSTPGDMFTSLNALTRTLNLANGTHNLKLEVEDRAGNISEDFLLEVFVDDTAPAGVTPNLLDSSDSGLDNTDNVTNKWQPAFDGVAEINNRVFVYATRVNAATSATIGGPVLIGDGLVGSENSNDVPDDGLGAWEVTVEPLIDGVYDITVRFEDAAGNFTPLDTATANALRIVVDKVQPNTPLLDLINDTGENLADEITFDNTPDVAMTTTDPNAALAQALFQDNLNFRIYDRFIDPNGAALAEFLLYDSALDPAVEANSVGGDAFTSQTLILETLAAQFGGGNAAVVGGALADGTHNLKLEVEDRAGNISEDFLLEVYVDTIAPAAVVPNLLTSSDSGMFNDDNVTNKWEPAFDGVAEINNKVYVYATLVVDSSGNAVVGANPVLVGSGLVGSDLSNNVAGDGLGAWEVTVEPMIEGVYDITVRFEDWAGNFTPLDDSQLPENTLRIVIDKTEPNTPYLDLITDPINGDTGRSDVDNITKQNQPVFTMTSEDPNEFLAELLFDDNLKFRIYDRYESFSGQNTPEFLIYDSTQDAAVDAVNVGGDMFTSLELIEEQLPLQYFALFGADGEAVLNQAGVGVLADGVHNLKLEVEDRAGNLSHDFLFELIVDTVTPDVSFGLPSVANIDGLAAESDSGVVTVPALFADRVTNDTTPKLWGRAEANTVIRVYHDRDGDGVIDLLTDDFLGQTVAVPFDGNDAFVDGNGDPLGYWEITSIRDLNELVGIPKDGLRQLLVTAEDVAGNPMPVANQISDGVDALEIFIDTQGPQVNSVQVVDAPGYDLFDPKPSVNGPTPLINALDINFVDQPSRVAADFVYDALVNGIATTPGNYLLAGDHVGIIPIESVAIVASSVADGQPASATVRLTFFEPLPDDRLTLTILDNLVDPAGNNLDGESNADEPQEDPVFPSGDGVPGGDFTARFTVDTRPEIGSYVAQNIDLDINGNFVWDPSNAQIGNDATNVDLTFRMNVANPATGAIDPGGFGVHDLVFVGEFAPLAQLIVGEDAVFVVDISGSTVSAFGGDPVGDQNSDGLVDTILDAEIAAFRALNQSLIDRGLGDTSNVSVVAFSTTSEIIDLDPVAPGIQEATTPLADVDGNGVRDVDQALMALMDTGSTNFEAGLQDAVSVIGTIGTAVGNGNVIFLSDGLPNEPSSSFTEYADEVAQIRDTLGMNLRAFGVGPGASLPALQAIDPAAETFSDTNELLAAFGAGLGGGAAGNPSGFDQLAVYGWSEDLGIDRWLIDTNSDGVVNTADGDVFTLQPPIAGFDVLGAIPVAGNFDGNANNGDEIGLYNAGQWAFDLNRDFVIQAGEVVVNNNLFGHPIIGDFDGDGLDDAGVFNNNVFTFDLANDGFNGADQQLVWGFPGVLDRPVATDMDQDGIDDIGLWVPRNSAQANRPIAEWYFLISDDPTGAQRVTGTINTLDHPFEPVPFGNDLYAEFGDELALPIVGNFDPPVAAGPVDQNANGTGDFNQDGDIDGADFLAFQRGYTMNGTPSMADGDGNSDGVVDALDMNVWTTAYRATAGANSTPDGSERVFESGTAFLEWQRSLSSTALAASSDSSLSSLGVIAGSDRSAYVPGARAAAFDAFEQDANVAEGTQDGDSTASLLALAASSSTSETSAGEEGSEAIELLFSLDEESLDELF